MIRKYFVIGFLLTSFLGVVLLGCKQQKGEKKNQIVELQDWIEDYKNYIKIINYSSDSESGCDSITKLFFSLNLSEFKNKVNYSMALCLANIDSKESVNYLLKSVENGFHPSRIDTVIESFDWRKNKDELYRLNHGFWTKRDTSYFVELENGVVTEQRIRQELMANNSDSVQRIMENVDRKNQRLLLDLCKKGGFPASYQPSYFKNFRNNINPYVIASHANDSTKLKLLDYAIDSAKEGEISWIDPISISNSLFISGISHKEVYPLWRLYFQENGKLDTKSSHLLLYSLKDIFDNMMDFEITMYPSKYNDQEEHVIQGQLNSIKQFLIGDLEFNPNDIIISTQANPDEKDYRDLRDYQYTLTYKPNF